MTFDQPVLVLSRLSALQLFFEICAVLSPIHFYARLGSVDPVPFGLTSLPIPRFCLLSPQLTSLFELVYYTCPTLHFLSMPIRKEKTKITPRDRLSNPAVKRTGVFAANLRPPEYVENSTLPEPRKHADRGTYASPSLNKDLEYFHAVAAGEYAGPDPGDDAMLVLNLFRSTLTHILPIAERLTLGQAQGAPYYALNTTPSTTSHDEFNTLVVTRRHPVNAVYSEACVAEIQPKLNLTIPGVRSVAVLKQGKEEYNLAYGDRSTLGKIGECFGLYHKKRGEQDRCDEIALAFLYCDEGWRTLEEMADKRGIIWAKRPERELPPDGSLSADFKDLQYTEGKIWANRPEQELLPNGALSADFKDSQYTESKIWAKRPEQELLPNGALSADFKNPQYTEGKILAKRPEQELPPSGALSADFKDLQYTEGKILAKRLEQESLPGGALSADFKDPRYTEGKMAYLDFQQRWPQFISEARDAHPIMDILATAFFVVMTVQSRKERMIRELGALPGYTP